VNAANVFSGGRPDPADVVARPPAPGQIRWGKYADLVVNVGETGRLVFSRATGYLPYLQTAKGRFPFKPLAECREDPLCLCSFVRLVDDLPSRIVVHWRHVPDPASVVMTEVVHEYFIITPDGRVRREVRIGTERLDDFNDPANVTVQELLLSPEGLVERSLTRPRSSRSPAPAVAGAPLRRAGVGAPAAWLKFDEGLALSRDETAEAVGGTRCPIAGNRTLWKKGVSGTALAFDGYFSKVTLPRDKAPAVKNELTLEAWVVLGAYPWSDAGIVHQSSGEPVGREEYKHGYRDPYVYRPWKMDGYFLGVDPYGRPIFKVNGRQIGGGELAATETVGREDALPTYRWNHWPVGLNPSDGRYAVADDRVTHAALGGARRIGKSILYGFTDQAVTSLTALAKSWNRPPAVAGATGCENRGYDRSQRAYVLAATGRPISFTLQGSADTPVVNPCFVIEHWDSDSAARVTIDGQAVPPGPRIRQGIVRDAGGRQTMVIWLELGSVSEIDVTVEAEKS
jgi:hypothetical protein